MVVVGPSRSGKSTLMATLGRIFNASRIPTQKIVANERFILIDLIDKDVNTRRRYQQWNHVEG